MEEQMLDLITQYAPTILAGLAVLATIIFEKYGLSNILSKIIERFTKLADDTKKKVDDINSSHELENLKQAVDVLIEQNYEKDQKIDKLIEILTKMKTNVEE